MSENILVTVSEDDHKICVRLLGEETPLMVMTAEQATEMAHLFLQGAELANGLQRGGAEGKPKPKK